MAQQTKQCQTKCPWKTVYQANSLNQYTNVQTPGYKHVAGAAFATNTVMVNAGTAERRGEWFDREITITNSSAPVWQRVAVTDGTVTTNGGFVFPKASQPLLYDGDGNLTNDGVWSYEWDGENRLKAMSMGAVSGITNTERKRLEFGYDFTGRRFSKVVKSWNGSTFSSPSTNYFVYDGWNLLAILNPQLSTLNTFLWGQDLSRTMQEAGGVGGLLALFESGGGYFAMYDGNGNITGLIKQDKTTSARYEYSPFGETLTAEGALAALNPFRFSTKFHDDESGIAYYGARYFSPCFGRWITKDPAGERGDLNLSMFCRNAPNNFFDGKGYTPQQLVGLGIVGVTAETADTFFQMSSFTSLPGAYDFAKTGIYLQGLAVGLSITVDVALGGRLLKPVGGSAAFLGLYAGGTAAGYLPRLNKQQSLAAAVVSGRLSAVAAIGAAAMYTVRGTGSDPCDPTAVAAMGFLNSARRGETGYADLDAALLGLAIYQDQARDPVNAAGMLWDLLNGDAASAFSRLPSYQAINAWDMALEMEDYLEGI